VCQSKEDSLAEELNNNTMKKILLFSITSVLYSITAIAQCNYNKSNNTISVWDWKQSFYTDMYVIGRPNLPFYSPPGAVPGTGVPSPFIPPTGGSTNINLGRFYSQFAATNSLASVDCQPNDGWELLAKEFGSAAVPVNNPFFSLYNRHTGIVRAFFLAVQEPSSTQNGALVIMRHATNIIGQESAIFSHLYPITNPVENFIKGSIMSSPNYYVNQKGYWLYADFPVSYDPCVCVYPSKITFEYKTSSQMTIVLNGNINGYLNQVIASTPGNVSSKENIFDLASGIVKSGNQSYESWNKSMDGIDKFANKQHIDLQSQILFGTTNMKNLLTAIPYLGAAFGVLDYFQSLNKQTGGASPMQFGANLQFNGTGTISQSSSYSTYTYWTPGSNQNVVTEKTIYDNPLGVVSFLKPVKVDYVDYWNRANAGSMIKFPDIRQYKIAEPIKFALNPSANLEIIDIQASLVMKYKPMPAKKFDLYFDNGQQYGAPFPRPVGFTTTPRFVDKVSSVGLETESFAYNDKKDSVSVSLRTPYVPLSCFDNVSIFLHRNIEGDYIPDPANNGYLELAVKFIIKAKTIAQDQPSKEVIFLQTYFVKEQQSPLDDGNNSHRWEEGDGQYPTFNSQNGNAPAMSAPFALAKIDETLENTSISDGTRVMRNLKLGSNLNISSTYAIELTAGNEILVDKDTYIGQETTLAIGLPNVNCPYDINSMRYSQEEINSFCSGPKYKDHSLTKKSEDIPAFEIKDQDLQTDIKNILVVNPFSTTLNFTYSLLQSGIVSIKLINMSGVEILSIDLPFRLSGANSENINISNYQIPPGLYIFEVKTQNNSQRIKILKQ
jgi:hypothetical protein